MRAVKLSTIFIIEQGQFAYLGIPPGYLAAGDAYTRCYNEIIKNIPGKTKSTDDTLHYDTNIENAFYHMWD